MNSPTPKVFNCPYKDNVILDIAYIYLNEGLSIIPVKINKRPLIDWKKYTQELMDVYEVPENFERRDCEGIGIVCGKVSGNLEVIDVDTKNDPTRTIGEKFLEALMDFCPELLNKFPIVKTQNGGLHLYYKCVTIGNNQKLASGSDKKVIIETRGEGGYVLAPPTRGYEMLWLDLETIPDITPAERDLLLGVARSFDETPPMPKPTLSNRKAVASIDIDGEGLSPFDDFNQRGEVIALLEKHGWQVLRQADERIYLKRPEKNEKQSGANYHTGLKVFYVFTTSTEFEADKGYNHSQVFTTLECEGDFSIAAKKLNEAGYGTFDYKTPLQPKVEQPLDPIPPFPIEGLPDFFIDFIDTCSEAYKSPKDFWAGAVIQAMAMAMGDKFELKTKYENVPILWICLVGSVSIGKTTPLKECFKYFYNLDEAKKNKYEREKAEYEKKKNMSEDDRKKKGIKLGKNPKYSQYMLGDCTPEAMVEVHANNLRGIMFFRDELKGWLDDIGRYNKSGEQSNMLSAFTREPMIYNRKGANSNDKKLLRINKPCIFVTGGMQPELLPSLAKDQRAESGFLARFAFIFPDNGNRPYYNNTTVPKEKFELFYDLLDVLVHTDSHKQLRLTEEAETLYEGWYNRNSDQINHTESVYLKGAYGKLDIICLRLAVVVYGMYYLTNEKTSLEFINADMMQAAINITEYFRATTQKVNMIIAGQENGKISKRDVARYLFNTMNVTKADIAKILHTSRSQVDRYLA